MFRFTAVGQAVKICRRCWQCSARAIPMFRSVLAVISPHCSSCFRHWCSVFWKVLPTFSPFPVSVPCFRRFLAISRHPPRPLPLLHVCLLCNLLPQGLVQYIFVFIEYGVNEVRASLTEWDSYAYVPGNLVQPWNLRQWIQVRVVELCRSRHISSWRAAKWRAVHIWVSMSLQSVLIMTEIGVHAHSETRPKFSQLKGLEQNASSDAPTRCDGKFEKHMVNEWRVFTDTTVL